MSENGNCSDSDDDVRRGLTVLDQKPGRLTEMPRSTAPGEETAGRVRWWAGPVVL